MNALAKRRWNECPKVQRDFTWTFISPYNKEFKTIENKSSRNKDLAKNYTSRNKDLAKNYTSRNKDLGINECPKSMWMSSQIHECPKRIIPMLNV